MRAEEVAANSSKISLHSDGSLHRGEFYTGVYKVERLLNNSPPPPLVFELFPLVKLVTYFIGS